MQICKSNRDHANMEDIMERQFTPIMDNIIIVTGIRLVAFLCFWTTSYFLFKNFEALWFSSFGTRDDFSQNWMNLVHYRYMAMKILRWDSNNDKATLIGVSPLRVTICLITFLRYLGSMWIHTRDPSIDLQFIRKRKTLVSLMMTDGSVNLYC